MFLPSASLTSCPQKSFPFTPHPAVWRVLVRSLDYREVFNAEVKVGTHINLKELHAFLRLEERIGTRARAPPLRPRFAVCLGALAKGRANSAPINRCLHRSLG